MKTALVLIAHGSRHAGANDDLVDLADKIRGERRYSQVVPSYLELAEPDIKTACQQCVAAGAGRVVLLPYFLSAGVHVHRDLTASRDELAKAHPQTEFVLAEPLGRHPLLMEIVMARAIEAEAARREPS